MKIIKFLKIAFVKRALGLTALIALAIPAGAVATAASASAASNNSGRLFITSAVEHSDGTVTFPLHQGLSHGQPVYYVVTDASEGSVAALMGINTAQKLANAANTAGVEKVSINPDGTIVFPATVNFSPAPPFGLTPGPAGFPPAAANPPAVDNPGDSPLIQLPNGDR